METSEILKKVRKIEIKTRGLSQNIFAGQYHSAFKGRGMAFSEVREYQYGDDVRDIDWNVTARFHRPYVKVFEEERELTVMLLVDVSGSLESSRGVKSIPRLEAFWSVLETERTQFVKWEVYREGERVADGLSFTVYRTGRSPSAKATCVGEATTFRERLFP